MSIVIWAAVALLLLVTGKIIYLMFWTLLGAFLVILWVGHMVYKILYLFNPDFKPIKIVLIFIIVVILAVGYFKLMVAPEWNNWNSTPEEIEDEYIADRYCPDAELRTVRTLEVNVPSDYIFRWIRQLPEVGSYGLGLFDFGGKKVFEGLINGLPELQEGDKFLIGRVEKVEPGKSITFNIGEDAKFPKLGINCFYGGYYLRDVGNNKTRINMVMRADYDGFWGWFYSQVIIEFGDFLIATKQLSKLKASAEMNFGQ